jgi:hypothetical protein
MKRQQRNIKNRKIVLHKIKVPVGGRTYRRLLVTPRQLAKLNALPIGKEISLSMFYCYSGENMHVIRTTDGLQFMPSPYHTREVLHMTFQFVAARERKQP